MKKLLATLAVVFGAAGLTACNSACCDPCQPGPMVYQKPCCAPAAPCAAPCAKPCAKPCAAPCGSPCARPGMMPPPPQGGVAPMGGPGAPMPQPGPAAPSTVCGGGKCG
jgi:hypothetical protein